MVATYHRVLRELLPIPGPSDLLSPVFPQEEVFWEAKETNAIFLDLAAACSHTSAHHRF